MARDWNTPDHALRRPPALAGGTPAPLPSRVSWTAILAAGTATACVAGSVWPAWWLAALPLAAGCLFTELAGRSRARGEAARQDAGAQAAKEFSGLAVAAVPRLGDLDQSHLPHDSIEHLAGLGLAAINALSVERDNLRKVLDAVGDPVLVTDAGGSVRLWNTAAETFLSRSGDRISGRSIEELFTSADLVAVHAAAWAGLSKHATVRLPREGGIRSFEVMASPVAWRPPPLSPPSTQTSAGGSAAVLALRDITELAAASQLQTDFVANASHELRTPLSSIKGAVETLLDDDHTPPALRDRLMKMIAGNVARLEELIRDLLDLSMLESPETGPSPAPMKISTVVETLRTAFEPACLERRVQLTFDMDPALEHMVSDPRLLDLILRNLIENSIKFAYEESTIRVVGEVIEPAPGVGATSPATTLAASPTHSATSSPTTSTMAGARFRVKDKGAGIPLAAQQRVFERFYQVDPSRTAGTHRRGTGLGLAIVKSAVDSLRGTIGVESVWKQGTTMTVELPGCVERTVGAAAP